MMVEQLTVQEKHIATLEKKLCKIDRKMPQWIETMNEAEEKLEFLNQLRQCILDELSAEELAHMDKDIERAQFALEKAENKIIAKNTKASYLNKAIRKANELLLQESIMYESITV